MPRSSNQCCTGRALHPLSEQSSQPSEVHNTLLGAKSSSLWNQVQVQESPASISSPPATHQIPYTSSSWSLFQFLRCSWLQCIPFYLGKAQSKFQGQRPSCLWQALQKLFEEPGKKQDSTVPALCCSTMLGLPAASVAVLGNAKRDLLLSAFIRDNTNQVQPVAAWLHLPNAKFQGVIFLHWLLFFRLKIAGKCDVNTEQTQGLSGSAGLLILVRCWVEIVT